MCRILLQQLRQHHSVVFFVLRCTELLNLQVADRLFILLRFGARVLRLVSNWFRLARQSGRNCVACRDTSTAPSNTETKSDTSMVLVESPALTAQRLKTHWIAHQLLLPSMKSSAGAADSNLIAPSNVSPGSTPLMSVAALSSTEKNIGMHSPPASRVKLGALPVHSITSLSLRSQQFRPETA